MKYLTFCFVLCSIVLATLSPTKAYSVDLKKEKYAVSVDKGITVQSVVSVNFGFCPALLPDRIQDHVNYVTYLKAKNQAGMEFENKVLRPKTYTDKEIGYKQ